MTKPDLPSPILSGFVIAECGLTQKSIYAKLATRMVVARFPCKFGNKKGLSSCIYAKLATRMVVARFPCKFGNKKGAFMNNE